MGAGLSKEIAKQITRCGCAGTRTAKEEAVAEHTLRELAARILFHTWSRIDPHEHRHHGRYRTARPSRRPKSQGQSAGFGRRRARPLAFESRRPRSSGTRGRL